jgi:hypothetical protein
MSMNVILAVIAYFVFSAAVGAMSQPTEAQKGKFYGWFFRFVNILAANATRIVAARFPGAIAPDATESTGGAVAVATHTERDTIAVTQR